MNPNLLALIVAAIWGLAPIFEKMRLKELNPLLVLFVRFILVDFKGLNWKVRKRIGGIDS